MSVFKEHREPSASKVQQVPKGRKELKDYLVCKEPKVYKVYKVLKEFKGPKVSSVLKEQTVCKV